MSSATSLTLPYLKVVCWLGVRSFQLCQQPRYSFYGLFSLRYAHVVTETALEGFSYPQLYLSSASIKIAFSEVS